MEVILDVHATKCFELASERSLSLAPERRSPRDIFGEEIALDIHATKSLGGSGPALPMDELFTKSRPTLAAPSIERA